MVALLEMMRNFISDYITPGKKWDVRTGMFPRENAISQRISLSDPARF